MQLKTESDDILEVEPLFQIFFNLFEITDLEDTVEVKVFLKNDHPFDLGASLSRITIEPEGALGVSFTEELISITEEGVTVKPILVTGLKAACTATLKISADAFPTNPDVNEGPFTAEFKD